MSNIFELNKILGFEPPIQFQDDSPINDPDTVASNNQRIKNILVVVNDELEYEDKKGTPPENSSIIYIYASIKSDKSIADQKVNFLPESGLEYQDLNFFGVTLSKKLLLKVEKEKRFSLEIVEDTLRWFKIQSPKQRSDARITLNTMISSFAKHYPSDRQYEPPKEYEEFYQLLLLCVEIGFIEISETAGFIAEEVFYALAEAIRSLKLREEKWNPNIDKDNDIEYDPIFKNFSNLQEAVSKIVSDLENDNDKSTKSTVKNGEVPKLEESIPSLQDLFRRVKNYVLRILLQGLEDIISDLNHIIRLFNAYVVGFINGIIDFIASIVEGIGFLFSLLNYESTKQLIAGVKKFIKELSWSEITKLIKKELKELFAFMIGDEAYKNAYEFGLFIPKLLEAAVDIIYAGKGAIRFAKSIAEIIKEIPDAVKKTKRRVKQFVDDTKKLGFDKKLLDELNKKGINLDIKTRINFSANTNAGKAFDGRFYTISYDDIALKRFESKDKAQRYLDKINNDQSFLDSEINNSIKRVRTLIRNSKEFKIIDDWFTKNRTKFISGKKLNVDLVKASWWQNNNIIKKELTGERFKFLNNLKTEKLEYSNIAKAKIEIEIKGKVYELDYAEHSGKGKRIQNSKGLAPDKKVKTEDFFDPEFETHRANDSESKILDLIKEDFAKLMNQLDVKIDDIKVKKLSIDTTYDPCNVCKKELLLFQERFGGTMEISRPFYLDNDGIKSVVFNHDTYKKL